MLLQREFRRGCSIILPTWNSEVTLEQCLDSIPDAFPKDIPLELIIVDKNSTDKTMDIIIDWHLKYININFYVYVITESSTLGAARLKGIKKAIFPTIFWLDSDIVLPKNYIKDLFEMAKDYKKDYPIGQLQGRMHGTDNLAFRWWAGYGIATRRKNKAKYIIATNGPTANALVIKSALKMNKAEQAHLKKLHSTEDSFISEIVQKKGYVQLMYPIDTKHLVHEVCSVEGAHKIIWSLVGLKDNGYGKLASLWRMKWIWRNGFFSFLEYHTVDLILYTVLLQVNLIRSCLKDKRIIDQRRLTSLQDW